MEKNISQKSVSKLWRESGKTVPFKEFLAQHNEQRQKNFMNLVAGATQAEYNSPLNQVALGQAQPAPVVNTISETIGAKPKSYTVLYAVTGILVGVTVVMAYKKYKK